MSTIERRPGDRDGPVIAAVILMIVVTVMAVLTILSGAKMGRELADRGSAFIERVTPRSPSPDSPRRVQPHAAALGAAVVKPAPGPGVRP